MYINPIDISIFLMLSIMTLIGIKNGIIDEFKKTTNLFLSIILSNFILAYISKSFFDTSFMQLFIYIIILIIFVYTIGFIMNLIIYNLDSVKIDTNINKFLGGLLAPVRAMFIIIICITAFNFFPINESFKNKIISRLNNDSILFNFSNDVKKFLLE